jgi:hypothetical protein
MVNDTTRLNGESAIKRALDFLITINAASTVTVTGVIVSVYAIGWWIEITSPTGTTTRYNINWDKGELAWQAEQE